jgi:hypothetical protein
VAESDHDTTVSLRLVYGHVDAAKHERYYPENPNENFADGGRGAKETCDMVAYHD